MNTQFQENQVRSIHAELKSRFATRVKEFGNDFRDVILVTANRHGEGKVGFACEFGSHQTYASGKTLVEFAKWAFGGGRLVRIDDNRFAVLAK